MVRLTAALVILVFAATDTDATAQSSAQFSARSVTQFAAQSAAPRTPATYSSSATVSASHSVRIRLRKFHQFSDAGIRTIAPSERQVEQTVRAIRLFTNARHVRVAASDGEETEATLTRVQDDPLLFASTDHSAAAMAQNSGLLYYFPKPALEAMTTRYITVTE